MNGAEKAGSALDIGVQLGRYVAGGTKEDARMVEILNALVEAPCETPADALAVVAWAEGLMTEVLRMLQAGDVRAELAEPVAVAVLLCRRAVGALEGASGLAVEGFGGDRGVIN